MRSDNPLAPIPKVWIPAAAALVAIIFSWILSGDFAEAELAALLTTLGYFVLAYALPGEGGAAGGGAGHRQRRESRRAPLDYEEEERRGPADYETRQFPSR